MSFAGIIGAAAEGSQNLWHYAAWVALDLRLLLFIGLISLLTAAGISALFARGRSHIEVAALFIVSFTVSLTLCVVVFNAIAHYPVFVVESFFPFP